MGMRSAEDDFSGLMAKSIIHIFKLFVSHMGQTRISQEKIIGEVGMDNIGN